MSSATSVRRNQLQAHGNGHPWYRVRWRDEEGRLLRHALPPAHQVQLTFSLLLRQRWCQDG